MIKEMRKFSFFLLLSILFFVSKSDLCEASDRNVSEFGVCFNAYSFGMKSNPRNPGPGVFCEYRIGILDYLSVGAHADYMYGKGDNSSFYHQGGIQLVANLHLPGESKLLSPFLSVQSGPGYGFRSYSGRLSQQEFYLSYGARIGLIIKGVVSLSFVHSRDYDTKLNYVRGLYSNDGIAIGFCF